MNLKPIYSTLNFKFKIVFPKEKLKKTVQTKDFFESSVWLCDPMIALFPCESPVLWGLRDLISLSAWRSVKLWFLIKVGFR